MHRLSLKVRCARGRANQSDRARQIKIDKLATFRTDRVIMPVCFSIVAAGAVAESYLADHALLFQITERVIDRSETDSGQRLTRRFEDFSGRRVLVARAHHVKHDSTLTRETGFSLPLWLIGGFWLVAHEFRIILILNTSSSGAEVRGDFAGVRGDVAGVRGELTIER